MALRAHSRRHGLGIASALILGIAFAAGLGATGEGVVHGQLREPPPLSSVGQGRSVHVYPPQEIRLRMSHEHPAHAALACTRCHERAATSTSGQDHLWPAESSCVPCHEETDRARPSVARCGLCHEGASLPASEEGAEDLVGRIVIPTSRVPHARLRFSHAAHAQEAGGCEGCHAGVRSAGLATRAHLPTMRDCLRCHTVPGLADLTSLTGTASRATEPMECAGCHDALPDGRMRAHFGAEGWMSPPSWMAGMQHDRDWLVRHRWVAADAGSLCAECHVERECADCHDGRVRPRRVHPGDFLTTHPPMARRDEPRCASCHTVATFCSECHARLGLATFSAPATRAASRYHPPQAMWIRGPNLHGVEAQRSMQSCVSCHAEDDCVACHGAGAVGGGGVSPHPPGFASSCATVLSASPAACVRCHGDAESLRARCR